MNRDSEKSWTRWLKWGDFVLVGLISAIAVLLFVLLSLQGGKMNVSAVLTHNGQVLMRVSGEKLAVAGETSLSADGLQYKVIWQKGRIRFAEADCADQICVRMGWIDSANEIAVCVPGRLVLKIVGAAGAWQDPDEPDVISR